MPKRKRNHQICLRLTDDEFALWEQKCSESGMSQTDFLVSALKDSTVKIYRILSREMQLLHTLIMKIKRMP